MIDDNNSESKEFTRQTRALQQIRLYLFIVFGLGAIFSLLLLLKPTRVGDGSEYYALYLAFLETMRPWMTDASFMEYGRLVESERIRGIVPLGHLSQSFPALKLQGMADFNHFWFYSFLASIIGSIISLVGGQFGPHTSFLILHWLLLCLPTLLAFRYYGWKGVVVVLLMTFGSPMIWFLDKVHTELFTYCLALASIIYGLNARYVSAAVAMALASTQNPSFAIVAGFLLCARALNTKYRNYSFWEVVGVASTVFVVSLHPAYYFFRFGVPTPQLLAGGTDLGGNLANFYIWIFDPDLGLLPNWPVGCVFLVFGGISLYTTSKRKDSSRSVNLTFWLFLFVYFLVSIYSHSSTQNLNSGATPGVSRYALWYTPLLFPFALWATSWTVEKKIRIIITTFVFGFLLFFNAHSNAPTRPESYSTPTKLSAFIQKRFPNFYNPPAEVFFERYSGFGESPGGATVMAVVGPDCKKVLLLPGLDRIRVAAPSECLIDTEALAAILKPKQTGLHTAKYATLTANELNKIIFKPIVGKNYRLNEGGEGGSVLRSGWSVRETWGVWSDGRMAKIELPLPPSVDGNKSRVIALNLVAFTHGPRLGTQFSINTASQKLWEGELTGQPTDVVIEIPVEVLIDDRVILSLIIENPESPSAIGLSSDARKLGVGFISFRYLQ